MMMMWFDTNEWAETGNLIMFKISEHLRVNNNAIRLHSRSICMKFLLLKKSIALMLTLCIPILFSKQVLVYQ